MNHLKKLILASLAIAFLSSAPASAWHTTSYTVKNFTNGISVNCGLRPCPDGNTLYPVIGSVTLTDPGVSSLTYVTNILHNGAGVIGPIPESGNCLRTVTIELDAKTFPGGKLSWVSPIFFNSCTESEIDISGGPNYTAAYR